MALRKIRRKNSPHWHTDGSVAGQRIRQSLGTGIPARADELIAQLEARLWKRHSYGEEAVRSFDEAALSYQLAGGERRFLPPLIRYFKGRSLGSIKPGEIRAAAQTLYAGRSPATWNRQGVAPARAVINHAASLGWCSAVTVETFPVRKPKRVTVDRTWINALTAQADADHLPHLSAAVLFMWQTAARVSEAARVFPEHVDLKHRVIMLERTKEGAWEERALSGELMVRIANLPLRAGQPVFGYADRFGIRNAMRRVCARAGIAYVPPHQAGRHSAASHALAAGFSIRQVMDAFGWKTARMLLEIYAHTEGAGRAIADHFDTNPAQSISRPSLNTLARNAKRR